MFQDFPMPDEPFTCPFCNALVPTPAIIPPGARLICPRCEETFALKVEHSDGSTQIAPLAATDLQSEVDRHRAQSRSSVRIWRLLAILTFLGLAGLAAGLYFTDDPKEVRPIPVGSKAAMVHPLKISNLGYLPAGTDSVVAIQFGPFLRAFHADDQTDIVGLLVRMGMPEVLVDFLANLSAVGLADLDEAVIGTHLQEGDLDLGKLIFIMRTRQPVDLATVMERHKAKAEVDRQSGRKIYKGQVKVQKLTLDVYWWQVNDRVFAGALSDLGLRGIPETPRAGLDNLDSKLRERVAAWVAEDSYFWLALRTDGSESLSLLLSLVGPLRAKAKEEESITDRLKSLQILVMGVRSGDGEHTATLWTEWKSAAAANAVRDELSQGIEKGQMTVGGAGNALMLRMPAAPSTLRDAISRMSLRGKGKLGD